MQGEPDRQEPERVMWVVERAIVLQILRDDHEERWPREELAEEIADFEPAVLDEALECLEGDGVLHRQGDTVWAARAAQRLDELELISI
jgi:DNA-binding HxlR family transcriptional regulator